MNFVRLPNLSSKQRARHGLYFHVPFCPHLCPYCDFVKTDKFSRSDAENFFSQMLESLRKEIEKIDAKDVTVYFGGGTPGIFWGSKYQPFLDLISKHFNIEECTIETNPFLVSQNKVRSWKSAGFDRVTLGAQSLNHKVLRFLGRQHCQDDVLLSIEWMIEAGFRNIQADLIYGLADEVGSIRFHREIDTEIDALLSAGVSGISSYALTVEKNTLFSVQNIRSDDENAVRDYEVIQKKCIAAGLLQRETSNFSRYECKHNNIYWYGLPYDGFGPGAHGLSSGSHDAPFGRRYVVGQKSGGSERVQAVPGRDSFAFGAGAPVDSAIEFERNFETARTQNDYFSEMLFTLLRTPEGIPGQWLVENFGQSVMVQLNADPLLARGFEEKALIASQEGNVRLAQDQFLLGDAWHQNFLRALQIL